MAAALAVKGSMASDNSVEMRRYLNKLKDLVPHCPKNRKVTKLELIQHVIDYISDLQDTLQSDTESESPPESPVERMSFSDAYDIPPTHTFTGYPSQGDRHAMTQAGYSHGFGGSSHDAGHSYSGSSAYKSNTAYSSMAPAGAGYGVGCSSLGGAFSPILYSDQGTAPPPRFASS